MTTPRRRAFVSIATTMIIALALGACIRAPSRPVADRPMSTDIRPLIRFDNLARERVDVYLIGEKREWFLGRVDPGAIAILRVPDGAFAEGSTIVRLAVLVGERATFEAARHTRALTVAQPVSAILSQRWSFSRGELISLRR